jgi:hypothetical protein
MLKGQNWLAHNSVSSHPKPLPSEASYMTTLEQATPPTNEFEKQALQNRMGWNYRQVIGELIYPAVKCRPDIMYHTTKLSQDLIFSPLFNAYKKGNKKENLSYQR